MKTLIEKYLDREVTYKYSNVVIKGRVVSVRKNSNLHVTDLEQIECLSENRLGQVKDMFNVDDIVNKINQHGNIMIIGIGIQ